MESNLRTPTVACEKIALLEEMSSEESCITIQKGKSVSSFRYKLSLLMLIACGFTLITLLRGFIQTSDWAEPESITELYQLVEDDVPAPVANVGILENFQVYQPVLAPSGVTDEITFGDGSGNTATIEEVSSGSSCEVLLMDHSFGWSYGIPFVGQYTPPKCNFNRVTMNFTATSRGRQFDRLAIMYFNDTELWRTSTAEPTVNGIRWEYIKDMSEYLYFWENPQTLIFDLGNIIDSTYTGFFNTTLTATFFTSQDTVVPADLIIPISARHGAESASSMFVIPGDNATNTVTLPRNINRAVFSVSACGQATEEFWWGNVLQSNINTFLPYDGTLYGYSPFREVQVLIDGQLAGVHWPFPVIFTGGVVPGLWRPIAGIDAFDLREHEIDITPFLPLLCDGTAHAFEIRVIGIEDDGKTTGTLTSSVGSNWYVTGKIFLWLDSNPHSITTGTKPSFSLLPPKISLSQTLTQDASGANETLKYTTNVQRSLSITSTIKTQSGGTKSTTWTQNLAVANYGLYTAHGAIQLNRHKTVGVDTSSGNVHYKSSYTYPLYANTSYLATASGNFTIGAELQHGLTLAISGTPVFPTGLQSFASLPRSAASIASFEGTQLSTMQNGTAVYFGSPSTGTSSSFGTTSQVFSFEGLGLGAKELYFRSVEAVNASVVRDFESLVGVEVGRYGTTADNVGGGLNGEGVVSPKQALGRGWGEPRAVLVQGGGGA